MSTAIERLANETTNAVADTWKGGRNADDEENVVNTISLKVHSLELPGDA